MFKISFLTSSRVKLSHARYLARSFEVDVLSKRQYGRAYLEPRTTDRAALLQSSFNDAYKRWVKTGANPAVDWFFIEDTSVIIDALSVELEFPGLDVKYWMRETNFSLLDSQLKDKGNNRSASIRSDVVLYVPIMFRRHFDVIEKSITFTSQLRGRIVEREQAFETDLLYPWLDNKSFNRWFVPDGLSVPISLLSIQEATRHDFRASIKEMLQCLEAKRVIKRVQNRPIAPKFGVFEWASSFVICGLPCSGKTTLGIFLAETYGYYHVEASDFMRMAYYDLHGPESDVPLELFAERALKETPGIVVERILKESRRIGDIPLVITGFRSPKEIIILKDQYRGTTDFLPFVIKASRKRRYIRSCSRNRNDKVENYADFVKRDKLQANMGLRQISKNLRQQTIFNNSSQEEYFRRFHEQTTLSSLQIVPAHLGSSKEGTLEHRILLTLAKVRASDSPRALTTTEIAHLIKSNFPTSAITTNKNNVSRYFNFKFHPYYKVERVGNSIAYTLTQTGYGRALSISRGLRKLHPSAIITQLDLGF